MTGLQAEGRYSDRTMRLQRRQAASWMMLPLFRENHTWNLLSEWDAPATSVEHERWMS